MEAASKWALLCLQPHSWLPPPVGEVVTAPHPLPPFTEGSIPPQSPIPLYPTPQGSHLSSLPPHHGQPSSLPTPMSQGSHLPSLPPCHGAAIFPPCPQVTGQPAGFIKTAPPHAQCCNSKHLKHLLPVQQLKIRKWKSTF